MNATLIKRIKLVLIVILSLPILLHVYNPSMQLGGWGLLLGIIGYTISPVLLFVTLIVTVAKKW